MAIKLKLYGKSKIYGLTGPIGSGKSRVSNYLKENGAYIIDADLLARKVIEFDSVKEFLKNNFPRNIFTENNKIDRKALGNLIFNSKEYMDKLNSKMHPLIYSEFINEYNLVNSNEKLTIYSAPLLLNSKFDYNFLSGIIVINTNPSKCIERIIKRDNLTKDEALIRISKQIPISKQIEKADFIIDNNLEWENTTKEIDRLLEKLMNCKK